MDDMTTRTTDRSGTQRIDRPSAQARGSRAALDADDLTWSKGHRIAFRAFSGLTALFMLAVFVFGLLEVVIMWLPGDTLLSIDSGETYPGGLLVHRSHFMAVGLVAWTVVPAVLVQVRKPGRRVAPMLVAVVMGVAGLVAFGLDGTLAAWVTEDLLLTLPIFVLAALHPRVRQLFRRPDFHPDMIRWGVTGAVPWALYALTQAGLQFRPAPGDVHGGIEHWGTAFMMAVAVISCAVIGASDHEGWRLPAWTAALASVLFGVHSLVFPGLASGLPPIAAVGAVAWGVVYAVALARRSRAPVAATSRSQVQRRVVGEGRQHVP